MLGVLDQENIAMQTAPDLNDAVLYRSGAAARLSGVPVETLRVWERRYAIVRPQVSPSGRKLYSADNIQRLRLIKQLVSMGNPIGSVASLPMQTLQQMLADSAPLVMAPRPRPEASTWLRCARTSPRRPSRCRASVPKR
jgi:DNA-binding transcriptional MerR regulator